MNARRADSGTTDVRAAILEAATALFTERGADGLSMRQIANEIGYSATTIYLHFKDKDTLMFAVCSSGFEEFGATLESAARSAATPLEGLYASAEAYVRFALDNPMLYDAMFIRPRKWAITAPGDPESFQGLTGLVAATMATGGIRQGDPREVAAQIWSVLHGTVSLGLVFGEQITICQPDAVAERSRVLTAALLASLAD